MSHSIKCVALGTSYFEANASCVSSPGAGDLPVSVMRSRPVEIVNCAPITGRDEERRRFPWATA